VIKLKLENEQLNLNQKQLNVEIKIRNYFNQWEALKKQARTQELAVSNYRALVKAEDSPFSKNVQFSISQFHRE